ncbi:MAG: S9 family peptidase [Terriglobia bacterium]
MRSMVQGFLAIFLILTAGPVSAAAEKRPLTFRELVQIQRVSDPQLSPDGRWVAFTVTTPDLERNTVNSDIWLVSASGGEPRPLTRGPGKNDRARWSPESRRLVFVSNRSGTAQLWMLSVESGSASPVDTGGLEASGGLWSPDGKYLAFVSDVYPDCPDFECSVTREKQRASDPVKAKTLDRLLYRHWNFWKDGKRSHLFVIPAGGGSPRDLTPGDIDVPPFALGGPDDYAFSVDGKEICFVQNTDPDETLSTNKDVFIVPIEGNQKLLKISQSMGADQTPRFSPDGQWIAFRSQQRPGYEADRWQLLVYDRKTSVLHNLTGEEDFSVESFEWAPDSKSLYGVVGTQGLHPIYRFDLASRKIHKLLVSHSNDDLQVSPDGQRLVFLRQSFTTPFEIYTANSDGSGLQPLTQINAPLLSQLDLSPAESIWYEGAGGTPIQAWTVKPPRSDPKKKYPLLLLIHGGPQQVWSDAFQYRWNGNLFAAQGYVVLMPNPRGSTSFGQRFTDEIRNDWGGKPYLDLMKGVDHVISLGYVDPNRLAAAGGSYGGYMTNWLEGHTDRFRCLISHAGPFNLTSMYGATEELWFPEWEFQGTPWTNPHSYEQWSPHLFVKNFKTPMLIIHGELDYRVPIGEAFQFFTTLQRQQVPSKMLYFPDEGHWILKPKNSELWYKTIFEWLETYLKPRGDAK